jgi:hypothetical protein
MDINNIELPASLVADLYHASLVDLGEKAAEKIIVPPPAESGPARTDKPETAWKSLGNNQKNILVVVNNNGIAFLPDNELSFLTGVLGACKLSLDDVAIINFSNHHGMDYKEMITHFKSRVVLLFDLEPAAFGLPMSFPYYQIQPFSGNSFLYSPSLKELENDRVEKSKLWVCLKRLFNL